MTGEYEADSLLLGSRVAFKLAEENPPPWPCHQDAWCRVPPAEVP